MRLLTSLAAATVLVFALGCSDPPADNDNQTGNDFNVGQNDNNDNNDDNDNNGTTNDDEPGDICEPWDAGGSGLCDMVIGYGYDGDECVSLGSGCDCDGADCERVAPTKEGCLKQVRDCDQTCGDPDAEICDEYADFDPAACPDDSAYTVVGCRPQCVDPSTCTVTDLVCPGPDEGYHYQSDDPDECEGMDINCGPHETFFHHERCGCGCAETGGDCPDPDDPEVVYYDTDPDSCDSFVEWYGCGDDQQLFDDECGCGCIANEGDYECEIDECPDGTYCRFSDGSCQGETECRLLAADCTADYTEVCGCDEQFHVGSSSCAPQSNGVDHAPGPDYCIADDCPGLGVDHVDYQGFTDEFCSEMGFPDCDEDQDPFDDECGCGCIDQP